MAVISSCLSATLIGASSKLYLFEKSPSGSLDLKQVEDITDSAKNIPIVKTTRQDETSVPQQSAESTEVLAVCISPDSSLMCAATSQKTVHIFKKGFVSLRSFRIPKAPTSMIFDSSISNILIGDRAGNVTQYAIDQPVYCENRRDINGEETNHEGIPLTGGITMILSLALSSDGRFLISGDRDEKIRISRYPNSFVIHSFALGHKEYVRSLAVHGDTVLSAGGDRTIRQFSVATGEQLAVSEVLFENKPIRKIGVLDRNGESFAYVCSDDSNDVLELKLSGKEITASNTISLTAHVLDFDVQQSDCSLRVITRDGFFIVDLSTRSATEVVAESDLRSNLAKSKDPLPSYYKNVTHQNMIDYNERKQKKLEKKGNKRRAENQTPEELESKKQEVEASA